VPLRVIVRRGTLLGVRVSFGMGGFVWVYQNQFLLQNPFPADGLWQPARFAWLAFTSVVGERKEGNQSQRQRAHSLDFWSFRITCLLPLLVPRSI
jgi:hypothetical protein